MNVFIDREKLLALLRYFHQLTGIRVAVFDNAFCEIAAYPADHGDYCRLLRESPRALERCVTCDREACEKSKRLGRLVTYRCHAGMGEAVAPVCHDKTAVAYIMMGQMRLTTGDAAAFGKLAPHLVDCGLNIERLREAYAGQKTVTKDVVVAAANILQACAGYLYLDGMISVREHSLWEHLDALIQDNLDADLSVERLCADLSVSRERLYALFSERYGVSVAEHIRRCRIARAKNLLRETTLPIGTVAIRCGFPDYNYFTKVFRRYCGMAPREFRKTRE